MQDAGGTDADETILAEVLVQAARRNQCEGLTISGGDPFEQADALLRLLRLIRGEFRDILVYTGYELKEIREGISGQNGITALDWIDVLIDGRYMEDLNFPNIVLRGSANQVIHYLNPGLKTIYTDYMKRGRIVETFSHLNTMIITGILDRGKQG